GPAARRRANSSAAASSSTAGTTRLTRPSASACAAGSLSPKNASSFAFCMPIRRGSRYAPPPSITRPRRTNTSTKEASSAATTRAAASARCAPMPAAAPFTTAITGLPQSSTAATSRCAPFMILRMLSVARLASPELERAIPVTSAPEQKCLPLAAITTTRIAWSASASSTSSMRRSRSTGRSALAASGRFSLIRRMPSASPCRTAASTADSTLMRPPRWRSSAAFAGALCLLIRSQARSCGVPRSLRCARGELGAQVLDAVQEVGPQRIGRADRADIGQQLEQHTERDRELQPGQVGAEAVVRPGGAEGDVRAGLAGDVERGGVAEVLLVLVGRAIPEHHLVSRRELLVAEHDAVPGDRAAHVQHGRCPADDFLNRAGRVRRRIALPQRPLAGELGQGEQAVRDRVAGGLVARADQQDKERRELVGGQVLLGCGRDEQGDEVAAGGLDPV